MALLCYLKFIKTEYQAVLLLSQENVNMILREPYLTDWRDKSYLFLCPSLLEQPDHIRVSAKSSGA